MSTSALLWGVLFGSVGLGFFTYGKKQKAVVPLVCGLGLMTCLYLVRPVVRLLRATHDWVFHDEDSIRPGRKWAREIEEALRIAHLVVIFWCTHSARSEEVRKEYEFALTKGKNLLPVLLDTTPLPNALGQFQWVDFQEIVGGEVHKAPPAVGMWALGSLVGIFAITSLFFFWSVPLHQSGPNFPPGPTGTNDHLNLGILLLVVILFLVGWGLWRVLSGDRSHGLSHVSFQQLAKTLQTEMLTRVKQ